MSPHLKKMVRGEVKISEGKTNFYIATIVPEFKSNIGGPINIEIKPIKFDPKASGQTLKIDDQHFKFQKPIQFSPGL